MTILHVMLPLQKRAVWLGIMSILLLCKTICSFSRHGTGRQRVRVPGLDQRLQDRPSNVLSTSSSSENTMVVPLFPLRKNVKLPGESLTLNLYEERYLALAEWIVQQRQQQQGSISVANPSQQQLSVFGALYTADKPQIASQHGTGPIVPMLEIGDIGVFFLVETYEDSMIPTVGGVCTEQPKRRRIRIVGTGIARFRIEEILSNGWDTSNISQGNHYNLPFILARVSLYTDEAAVRMDALSTNSGNNRTPPSLLSQLMTGLQQKATETLGIPASDVDAESLASFLYLSSRLGEHEKEARKQALQLQSAEQRLRIVRGEENK